MDDTIMLCSWVLLSTFVFVLGILAGYWLRVQDEADGVVSALRTALIEGRVPEAVRQEVIVSSPTEQLLTLVHWKLKHNSRSGKGRPVDYKRCRSVASRIMLIKPQ